MKKTWVRFASFLLLLSLPFLFSGCSFLPDFDLFGTSASATQTNPAGPSGETSAETALTAMNASDPTRIDFSVRSAYPKKGVTLTAELVVMQNGETAYCSYRTDRLLTLSEAEKTGSAIGSSEGWLRMERNTVVARSADINLERLTQDVNSFTLFAPGLTPRSFTSVSWEETVAGPVFYGEIRPEAISSIFTLKEGETLSFLSLRLTLSESRDCLLAAQYRYVTAGGADVTVDATFSYTAQTIPVH